MALLGIYGIARTYPDTIIQLFQRLGNFIIFPKIAASVERAENLRTAIGSMRLIALLLTAVGLAMAIALADQFIYSVCDKRYHLTGFFLPVLLFRMWFSIMATMADAILMGIGKPAGVVLSNAAKLSILLVALPIVLARNGVNAALVVFVLAEFGRYAVVSFRQRSAGIYFTAQDILVTAVFTVLVFVFRELTMLTGLTGGIMDWVRQAGLVYT